MLALLGVVVLLATRSDARAQADATLTVLYRVGQSSYGASPNALVLGSDGNLYGTSGSGGTSSKGFAFKLTPAGAMTGLHDFGSINSGGTNTDGLTPVGGLTQGKDGNFYGVTSSGGSDGKGTFYRITPAGVFTVLRGFGGTALNFVHNDPFIPSSGLVRGTNGDFYGVSSSGGTAGGGTVYEITTAGRVTVLHNFSGTNNDVPPISGLTVGSDGNFYGLNGTQVLRITPAGALTVLCNLVNSGGALLQGHDGNFYGTFLSGGNRADGTVFKLTPAGQLTTLHNFYYSDGDSPEGALVSDDSGNLYGTTFHGGNHSHGTVFRVNPAGELTVLYSFTYNDGGSPFNGVLLDGNGDLYGLGSGGDSGADATIFKLHVNVIHPPFFVSEAALDNGVYYLGFTEGLLSNTFFGYYSYLSDPHYIYHFDLGYEYVFDAVDGNGGVYFYDFSSRTFFYTSPIYRFPYLYDFTLKTVLYYYPDPNNAGRYNTNGVRYFYNYATGQIITK